MRRIVDRTKLVVELGWRASVKFDAKLRRTIEWYRAHREWTEVIHSVAYRDGI